MQVRNVVIRAVGLICLLISFNTPSFAAVDTSLRPIVREAQAPSSEAAVIVDRSRSVFAPRLSTRPVGRTGAQGGTSPQVAQNAITFEPVLEEMISPRPRIRPFTVTRRAQQPQAQQAQKQRRGLGALFGGKRKNRVAQGAQGSVCQDSAIKGEAISPIPGKISGCGLKNGVRVTSVDGVTLTQAASIDCNTARALKTWVREGVKPAIGRKGGGVKSLKVVAHYSCRTRNNRRGAKISEHGKGRAIDIAAINLNNGETLTVLKGWRNRSDRKVLKKMHAAACGPFGTVLGPDADRYHQDHFHFDTARHRSGSYCR